MKVFITGANGFVELNTVKTLMEGGHEARADVRSISIAVIKWMEYIKFNKNFIFQSIFRYLHKFLCFHAGNNRYNVQFLEPFGVETCQG